jgi:hypothetical protein
VRFPRIIIIIIIIIPGKHSIYFLQKTAELGTSQILGNCYNQKLEARVVVFTAGSRGKVSGKKLWKENKK